ncbi:MAG: DUF6179 domain-containing protein [Coriobacteriales bacterium]|nr:DUF6179 domain-containing protein [Coriobacteriales bacterium]
MTRKDEVVRSGACGDRELSMASARFAQLMRHVANLYCMGDCSTLSAGEAAELAASVAYVLGIDEASANQAARVLDVDDPIRLWHDALRVLDARVDGALDLWQRVIATMPPLHNVSLRDTLVSLGDLRRCYDTRFAAHEVPCDIDYQLSSPIDPHLKGIDYIEAWLEQLMAETRWIVQFTTPSCERVLERACPDYRGLHVNLYDLLRMHESELEPR